MKIKNIDILFILLPPSSKNIPSPAFSKIKGYLSAHEVNSKILYGNFLYEEDNEFFKEENTSETEAILPFIYLLDLFTPEKSEYIKMYFKCFWPDLFLADTSIADEIMKDISEKYVLFINETIEYIKRNDIKYVGFTSKFSQWIPATVVAKFIKEELPDVSIIFGGWTNSLAAESFMKLNTHCDFAIWGEGEIPIKELIFQLKYGRNFQEIPRLIHRQNGVLCKTHNGDLNSYINLNFVFYSDFDDYFEKNKSDIDTTTLIPIERGRGCNWNKCSFCYLSQGYKFRIKSNDNLISEIKYLIEKHNVYSFFFTDNDVVGSDLKNFNELLDDLIVLRIQYPLIQIKMAEIISKGIDYNTIQKMQLAGFTHLQVGLESISDKLLRDINKKQSIVDNFFFIKSAINNGIIIKGANIIIDTPNETDEMIMESINRLHSYRFLLASEEFNFNIIPLAVANFSRYLKKIKFEKWEKDWSISELEQLLSAKYSTEIDRFSLMDYVLDRAEKPLWNLFNRALKYYKRKKHSYILEFDEINKETLYKEYCNDSLVKEILFDDILYWQLLTALDKKIINKVALFKSIYENKNIKYDQEHLENCFQNLVNQNLIVIDSIQDVTSVISIK